MHVAVQASGDGWLICCRSEHDAAFHKHNAFIGGISKSIIGMKTCLVAFLIFLASHSFAQQPVPDGLLNKVTSLKVSIFDMLEPSSNTFLLSYEFHPGSNVSLLSEGGFIAGKYKNDKANGFKFREEVRWLLPPKPRKRTYVGLQFMHKNFIAKGVNDEFVTRNGGYFEYLDFDYIRKVDALHLTLGFIKAGNGRQVTDIGFFFGGRKLVTKAGGVPEGWSLRNDGDPATYEIFIPDEVPQSKLYLSYGIYFRYGFRVGPL